MSTETWETPEAMAERLYPWPSGGEDFRAGDRVGAWKGIRERDRQNLARLEAALALGTTGRHGDAREAWILVNALAADLRGAR